MKNLKVTATLFLVVAPSSVSQLLPISFDAFRQHSPCGVIASVGAVRVSEIEGQVGWDGSFDADLTVERGFGWEKCEIPAGLLFSFSSEVHSSYVEPGMRVVAFLKEKDGKWIEAAYGRSIWPIVEINGTEQVQVGGANDFLLAEYASIMNTSAYLDVGLITRIFNAPPGERNEDLIACGVPCALVERECPKYECCAVLEER